MKRHRLNFVIPNDLDEALIAYQSQTGRTPSDVVRQLLVEWVEGDRRLAGPAREHPEGRRTQTTLSEPARAAVNARITEEGHGTIAAVVAALLRPFLAHRVIRESAQERGVVVPVQVSADLEHKFLIFGERWNWTPADCFRLLAEDPAAFDRLLTYALKQGSADV